MENLEMISFQIISCVGTAKSSYIEAARKAQEYEFDKAEELIKEGDAIYIKGHEAHASLIQQEARGDWNGNTLFPLYFVTNSKQDLLKDL